MIFKLLSTILRLGLSILLGYKIWEFLNWLGDD